MNITLTDDLQRLLRKKVENGQFPSEEAAVEEAVKLFLTGEPNKDHPRTSSVTELPKGRLPGPFLEDESVPAPGTSLDPAREWRAASFMTARGSRTYSPASNSMYKTPDGLRAGPATEDAVVPLSQGDILDDCPLVFWADQTREVAEGDQPLSLRARLIILTQACDLANEKAVRAAL